MVRVIRRGREIKLRRFKHFVRNVKFLSPQIASILLSHKKLTKVLVNFNIHIPCTGTNCEEKNYLFEYIEIETGLSVT